MKFTENRRPCGVDREPEDHLDRAVKRIENRGYKATPQRIAVLRVLGGESPLTPGEVSERCVEAGLVTVYRSLALFTEIGLVRRVDLGRGPKYEAIGGCRQRLICEPCGRIFDLVSECPGIARSLIESEWLLDTETTRVEVYARCRNRCAACS